MNTMPKLTIGDLVVEFPIIQGGMGVGISGVSLASSVADHGGIGVLSAAGMGFDLPGYSKNPVAISVEALRQDIRACREKTNGVIGINIMVALSNFAELSQAAIEEHVDIIFAGAGLPLELPKYLLKDSSTKLVPIVSSAKAATLLIRRWKSKFNYVPDAFVLEGPLAGGHLGFKPDQIDDAEYKLEKLLPQVVEAVQQYETEFGQRIPIIAAGGIYTGEDIGKMLLYGASGVQMGTRFVTTVECDASAAFKEAYLTCREEEIIIIDSPVGMPGRAIRNDYLNEVQIGHTKPLHCPYHCIRTCDIYKSPYCIARALINAKTGDLDKGFAFAGQNAYKSNCIVTVRELMESLRNEFTEFETCS